MEGKKDAIKEKMIKKNDREFDLPDNTSDLSFSKGDVVSRGTIRNIAISVDLRYCKGCGICCDDCPTSALVMVQEEGKLKKVIQKTVSEAVPVGIEVEKEANLTWQKLPHHAGLIMATGEKSDNLTGAWRVGEVVIPDSNHCVNCGLCSQVCPEGIIDVIVEE